MRQVRASFLFLLFITSFARCWADTNGLLSGSELACCVENRAHDEDHPRPEEDPADCAVCVLVQSGFMAGDAGFDLPPARFTDFTDDWADFAARVTIFFAKREIRLEKPPAPPDLEPALLTSRLVTAFAVSVRGPDLG